EEHRTENLPEVAAQRPSAPDALARERSDLDPERHLPKTRLAAGAFHERLVDPHHAEDQPADALIRHGKRTPDAQKSPDESQRERGDDYRQQQVDRERQSPTPERCGDLSGAFDAPHPGRDSG